MFYCGSCVYWITKLGKIQSILFLKKIENLSEMTLNVSLFFQEESFSLDFPKCTSVVASNIMMSHPCVQVAGGRCRVI